MNKPNSYALALVALAVLYFMMGFITVLNDTLVPFFKKGFDLTYTQSSLVQFYFYLSYGLVSIPAGRLVVRLGYKKGMVLGFVIAALGAFLFLPSAHFHEYRLFLCALFIIAIGVVLLQVSANPYIAVLGPPETAASRLTLIQGVGSIGTTLAPLFGAYFILSKIESAVDASDSLVLPYGIIAMVMLLVAIVIWVLRLPTMYTNEEKTKSIPLLQLYNNNPKLRYGVIALFFYVGAEVAIGTYLTNYIADKKMIDEHEANYYVSYYWGGMLVGRLIGAYVLRHLDTPKVLSALAFLAFLAIGISICTSGTLSVWLMIVVGLFNSVMFASIFSISIQGLGKYTGQASGLLSTAIIGGAIITWGHGVLKDHWSWSVAFVLSMCCYLIIFAYAQYISHNKTNSDSLTNA